MMKYQKNIMKFGKKVSDSIKTLFDSEPIYNEKYRKAKIKFYKEKLNKFLQCQNTRTRYSMYLSISNTD